MYGPLITMGIQGKTLSDDEKKFIITNQIGGVVLFQRNFDNIKQFHELCHDIQSLRLKMPDKTPLFLSIDMEGGRVQRLKEPFTVWPSLRKLGDLDNPTLSFLFSQKMGQELRAFGINVNFAPCADILSNPKNAVIGDRSLGSDPEHVAKHVSAIVRGYIKSDVLSCVKHFPGHGNTLIDSHDDLPKENVDLKRLQDFETIPFKRAFKARVEMCMMSHILFTHIDPKYPASLSEIFIQKVLKEHCRFRGLVATDDLDMGALRKHFSIEEIAVQATKSGSDILLYCNEPLSPVKAIEAIMGATAKGILDQAELAARIKKIQIFKKDNIQNPDPISFEEAQKVLGSSESKELADAIRSGNIPEKFAVIKS
ncbi:MAG: beta-N-acetylhexosaminidase [Bdellovibrionaceae bacterium]|nr:beta-N-acetylhexosaminidase [Pseudobdellovibrionaceae bacterium]